MIQSHDDLTEGAAWLAQAEPRFAPVLDQVGDLPLRLKPPGFKGLVEIIISQQVSVASADAIRSRMTEADLFDPFKVQSAGQDGLRGAGLSKPKARYVHALALSDLDYAALERLPDGDAIAALTGLLGIGPWTAQIYVMFCLGRADMFPPGDLALQEAARVLFDLDARPTPEALALMAQQWSPWRSVAARALFAYYRIIKQREGLG
ncbi:DNA-3-methyladenine glycosylase 2 family protein [Sulfitobacter mediterraneus]|nr:DNA-3-methyladenine glycosylase 2 family protein [Sulfitobacter mediterraneus]MBM1313068.1 DNA-3-methyladenine glycosylase 2 family protein [Sulfitobacter mediterraneus]MBM1321452.1 DNA-3-methyladenine glycosylase 2 family protein [Sulfitobacter mediterraneus]MBM1325339.1 DNA-3-methyladenine glycosylase 2 family protein [Sulfitobacter mediterraneus]MBM1396685.1 DNA-3-methyladenine glycosylase 2 family protein [Sulfitobacter mediterraneus]